jgi:hypothetical protein
LGKNYRSLKSIYVPITLVDIEKNVLDMVRSDKRVKDEVEVE